MTKQETPESQFAELLRNKVRWATGGRTGERITALTYEQRKAEWEKRYPNRPFSEPAFGGDVVEVRIVLDSKCGHRHALNHLVGLNEAERFNSGREAFAETVATILVKQLDEAIEHHKTTEHQESA